MKRFVVTLIGLLCMSLASRSQVLTIKELVDNTKCINDACFKAFVERKGFSFSGISDNIYVYSSDEKFPTTSNKEITSSNQAAFSNKSNVITVGFSTNTKSQFLLLVNELEALKYKKQRSVNENSTSILVIYSSTLYPKMSIAVRTRILTKEGLGSWTNYDFQVERSL